MVDGGRWTLWIIGKQAKGPGQSPSCSFGMRRSSVWTVASPVDVDPGWLEIAVPDVPESNYPYLIYPYSRRLL